jgi:hypothetical protein
LGLNKLSALEAAAPVRRYERECPGELIHIDIKKLGRIGSMGQRITGCYPGAVNRYHGIGWEFVHACIDDACASLSCRSWQITARKAPLLFPGRCRLTMPSSVFALSA